MHNNNIYALTIFWSKWILLNRFDWFEMCTSDLIGFQVIALIEVKETKDLNRCRRETLMLIYMISTSTKLVFGLMFAMEKAPIVLFCRFSISKIVWYSISVAISNMQANYWMNIGIFWNRDHSLSTCFRRWIRMTLLLATSHALYFALRLNVDISADLVRSGMVEVCENNGKYASRS